MRLGELFPAEINEKRLLLRQALERDIAPLLPGLYDRTEFPFELLPKLKALNLTGLSRAAYGCKQLSDLEKVVNIYELARMDSSLCTFYLINVSLVSPTIELLGSEEQKEKYLPRLASFESIGCWGLTEANYGSDASALETTAEPVSGGFRLNGSKKWIGNAHFADVMIIWARNTQTRLVQGFIANGKGPGVSVKVLDRKLSSRILQNGMISLKDVFVPESEVLPGARDFASGTNEILLASRVGVAWIPVGIVAGVYEHAVKYLRERTQFGAPLAAMQLNQEKLSRIMGIFQALFLQALKLVQMRELTIGQVSLVKGWNSLMGREACKLGREMLGGNGILIDFYMIKAMMDMEAVYTGEGAYDVCALVAGREMTGVPAFKPNYKRA
jgi:acyl-CoA oxidase